MPAVLIIGAGPSGLATAACLKHRGIGARLVDRHGVPGGAYRRMYPHIVLASPTRYTVLPGLALDTPDEYISAQAYRNYLDRYAAHHALVVEQADVQHIDRADGRFQVRYSAQAPEHYDAVVVATGMFEFPKWPALEGLASSGLHTLHSTQWHGPEPFRGRRLLIVGGATSAVEIAEECARAELRVVLSVRRKDVALARQRFLGRDLHDFVALFEWLPRSLMKSYCSGKRSLPGTDLGFSEFRRRGMIRLRPAIARVEGNTVVFADHTREEFNALVAATGYHFDVSFLPREVAHSSDDDNSPPLADGCENASWPRLYFVGMPCVRGLNSEFLRGIASDASWVARKISSQDWKRHAHQD